MCVLVADYANFYRLRLEFGKPIESRNVRYTTYPCLNHTCPILNYQCCSSLTGDCKSGSMASSNPLKRNLETPLLRVSRPISACSRCRNAKIKCDGKLPSCSACERSNRAAACSSANDQFAKGKERSYVASLESRIERLERQITQTKARQGSLVMLDVAPLVALSPADQTVGSRRKKERAEVSDVDDLVSDFGFL